MAFCTKQKEVLDLIESNIVDQTGPGCNLLLAELSRLGKIVEQSASDRGHESSGSSPAQSARVFITMRP